jgi:hypothetical protein
MTERITELVNAMDGVAEPDIRLQVTANRPEVPEALVNHPRIDLVGRIDHQALRELWARSRAIYFPPGIESFGYPLAEARVNGQTVIAPDSEQNREVAGSALCGFTVGDTSSLQVAIKQALTMKVQPDPTPFDPTAYFNWLLGQVRQ